jgi:hypothetical protein
LVTEAIGFQSIYNKILVIFSCCIFSTSKLFQLIGR